MSRTATVGRPGSTSGATIRALRELHGLTLSDLSARTGLSVSLLSRLETGDRGLTLPVAAQLLRVLQFAAPIPEGRG